MAKVLVAPNGLQIQGTLERVHGAGLMTNIRLEDGKSSSTTAAKPRCGGRSSARPLTTRASPCSSSPRATSGRRARSSSWNRVSYPPNIVSSFLRPRPVAQCQNQSCL